MKNLIKLILFILVLLTTFSCSSKKETYQETYLEAKVIRVVSSLKFKDELTKQEEGQTKILVKMLTGEDRDKEVTITQYLSAKNTFVGVPEPNTTVILSERLVLPEQTSLQIVDIKRSHVTLYAILLFVLCLLIIGGISGLLLFVFLAIIFLVTVFILFPLVSYGLSPVILTFLFTLFISFLVNLLTSNARNPLALIFGSNVISLVIVTIFAYFFAKSGSFSSLLYKESNDFMNSNLHTGGFIASSIILSSLGGIISVTKSTFNIANLAHKKGKKTKKTDLFYNILKQARPSIFINFLFIFFIYLGLGLPLLMSKYQTSSITSIFNFDSLSFYLISTSISGLGLISACLSSIFLFSNIKQKTQE